MLVPNTPISKDVRANHGSNEGDSEEQYRKLFLQAGQFALEISCLVNEDTCRVLTMLQGKNYFVTHPAFYTAYSYSSTCMRGLVRMPYLYIYLYYIFVLEINL